MATKDEAPMNFGVLLAKLADGQCLSELSSELQRLVGLIREEAEVRNEAVKGKLTFTLELAVAKKGHVEAFYDIKIAEPKKDRPETLLFLTPGDNLSDKMTKQQELPIFKEAPRQQARDIDTTRDVKEV